MPMPDARFLGSCFSVFAEVLALLRKASGCNPAYPRDLIVQPKKTLSDVQRKGIVGSYDFLGGSNCLNPDLNSRPCNALSATKLNDMRGTEPFPPTTSQQTDRILLSKPTGKSGPASARYHGVVGNYDLLNADLTTRHDSAGFIAPTPGKPVSSAKRREMVGSGLFKGNWGDPV